ncbi:4'-phosphopantetheinyl transferase superfamily protein [Robiginitalea sp.]|nr:4'-phosphopantetheinyl transferase superfamily protein [Robiginitalea sp.]
MPLYKSIRIEPDIEVLLWKVEETESTLMQGIQLTSNSLKRCQGMRSAVHRSGFLSIRHLLVAAGYSDQQLCYDPNGKPTLQDGKHISISHSFDFTGIILSDAYEVGIDIEMQRPKILRIADRFAAPEEVGLPVNEMERVQTLTRIWCTKESLYKIMSVPGLSFLQHIRVSPLILETEHGSAQVMHHEKTEHFDLFFSEFEGYTMGCARKRHIDF